VSAAEDFNAEIEHWVNQDVAAEAHDFQTRVATTALERIDFLTPVDMGVLRFNWQVSEDTLDAQPRAGTGSAVAEGKARIKAAQPYATLYIANPMPYATTVEYGGYPDPVKRGTYIRQKGRRAKRRKAIKAAWLESGTLPFGTDPNYEIRSAGGFSKQAPQGMVRITAQELENYREG
jgi:hypothetical protein